MMGDYEAVVIGVSAGGFSALTELLPLIPANFPLAIAIVQHRNDDRDNYLCQHLDKHCQIPVSEASFNGQLMPGHIYLAPANYHLLIETDRLFSLSVGPAVRYSIPSIDVLFESAADAYGGKLIGIVLTGANDDGSLGLKKIRARGGLAIVEDPRSAEVSTMPQSAIEIAGADHILPLAEIAGFLTGIPHE